MTSTRTAPKAKTPNGSLEGAWDGDVAAFLGIPFAAPPTGARRWSTPVAADPWDGTRTAVERGPIAPQPPSRLEAVMGQMTAPAQSEDCLNLNVWTPDPAPAAKLPTLVFIHGGGYISGSGSAAWHDGRVLAASGEAVVVTINYRLGALGYLYLPPELSGGEPVANLGLADQRLALEWVRSNVEAFGGDPANVTVFGQSGGAHSALGLAAMEGGGELFAHAILQSTPLGMPARDPQQAEATAELFLRAAGADGPEALRALPLKQILEAQRETMAGSMAFGAVAPPFQLVTDGEVLRHEPVAAAIAGSADGIDLLIGFTREDASPFFCADDKTWNLDAETLTGRVASGRGEEGARRLATYLERAGETQPATVLAEMVTDEMMIAPAIRLAEERRRRGVASHLFRFSWAPNSTKKRLGACHTIELPFVFGNLPAWEEAPMLGDAPDSELTGLAETVQASWLAFARDGSPASADLDGEWVPFDPDRASVMDLDLSSELLADPADGRRDLWP